MFSAYKAFCDASIEGGNPGGHAVAAWVLKAPEGSVEAQDVIDLGSYPTVTNNIAEYTAVKGAVEYIAHNLCSERVVVHTDSKLVVEQLNDHWGCYAPALKDLKDQILSAVEASSCLISFKWVPREENVEADTLSRSLY